MYLNYTIYTSTNFSHHDKNAPMGILVFATLLVTMVAMWETARIHDVPWGSEKHGKFP